MFIKDVGHNCASVAASSLSTGDVKPFDLFCTNIDLCLYIHYVRPTKHIKMQRWCLFEANETGKIILYSKFHSINHRSGSHCKNKKFSNITLKS